MSSECAEVTVRLFGPLRDAVGRREVRLPHPGGTVKDALARLADCGGDSVRQFILDRDGNVRRSLIVLLNDAPLRAGESDHARLEQGDVLSLLLPLAGG